MKIIWNNGFELDWRFIGALLVFVFTAGGGWWKLEANAQLQRDILEELKSVQYSAQLQKQDLIVLEARYHALEERIDPCCPLFHGHRQHR